MKRAVSRRQSTGVAVALAVFLAAVVITHARQAQPPATGQAAPSPDRQMPPVTFKVEVNYVEVDATVVDRQGNFVRDLRPEDFQVSEDGKPQKIAAFSLVDIPIERAEKPLFVKQPIEPDVRTNATGLDGRIYLLVLDDFHTAATRTAFVRTAARRFVQEQMGANDLAAVITTSGQSDAAQDFTSDRTLLLQAIDKFIGRKLRSPTLEKLEQYSRTYMTRQQGDPILDPLEAERAYNARVALDALKHAGDVLTDVRGRRKALVYISEGIDYDIGNPFDNPSANDIRESMKNAISSITRANVNVYSVDPRGLTDMGDEAIEIASLPDDYSIGLGQQSMMEELRISQDSLRVISDETGGFAAVNTNDFRSAFTRIVRENSSYYLLGYYSSNDRRDGRYRKLSVKVNRPDVEVHGRRGYVAPSRKTPAMTLDTDAIKSAELREALASPVPMSGLTFAVTAAAFKGTGQNASVVVTVQGRGSDLKFIEKGGRFDENIEVSLLAVARDGKIKAGDRQILNMALSPKTRAVVQQSGFRMISRLNLPPGRYQLRVGGRDAGGGRVGSVYYDLTVPDFSKEPLTMSGLVLVSREAMATPTPRPDQELRKVLPGDPTTVRQFEKDDEIALLTEVYDNRASTPHKVDITTTVLAEDGRTVYKHGDERSSSELGGKSGGYGYSTRIPLRDIPPGLYVLKVEAKSTLGKNESASREVQFSVVAN